MPEEKTKEEEKPLYDSDLDRTMHDCLIRAQEMWEKLPFLHRNPEIDDNTWIQCITQIAAALFLREITLAVAP